MKFLEGGAWLKDQSIRLAFDGKIRITTRIQEL